MVAYVAHDRSLSLLCLNTLCPADAAHAILLLVHHVSRWDSVCRRHPAKTVKLCSYLYIRLPTSIALFRAAEG